MAQETKNRRDDIVRAAIRIIATYGFHGAPVSLIAREAGVGAGSIYRYFRDKDTLIVEIFHQLDQELKRALLEGHDEGQPLRPRFFHLCRGVFRFGRKHPHEFKFIEQFCHSPYGINLRREKLFCECGAPGEEFPFKLFFDLGRRQGMIRDLPLPVLLALTVGPIIFLTKDHIAGLLELDEATIDKTIAACWEAIKTEGPGAGPATPP
jgi:AcrR family transcriptional regulator